MLVVRCAAPSLTPRAIPPCWSLPSAYGADRADPGCCEYSSMEDSQSPLITSDWLENDDVLGLDLTEAQFDLWEIEGPRRLGVGQEACRGG